MARPRPYRGGLVNGAGYRRVVPARQLLVHSFATRWSSAHAHSAATAGAARPCTVALDGRVSELHVLAVQTDGSTSDLEGIAGDGELTPFSRPSPASTGSCGYCTPGMLLSAQALLAQNPAPTTDETVGRSWATLRCTGYETSSAPHRGGAGRGAGRVSSSGPRIAAPARRWTGCNVPRKEDGRCSGSRRVVDTLWITAWATSSSCAAARSRAHPRRLDVSRRGARGRLRDADRCGSRDVTDPISRSPPSPRPAGERCLARDRVRYQGDAVAAVLAESRELARARRAGRGAL